MTKTNWFLIVLCVTATAAAAHAVEGTVYDATGGLLAGAQVMLMQNYEKKAETVSDEQGRFTFPQAEPGLYHVVVHKDRFALGRVSVLVREERAAKAVVVLTPDRMRDGLVTSSTLMQPAATDRKPQPRVPPAGGKLEWHKMLKPPRPAYPEKAALAGIQGPVLLFLRVRADGTAEVLSTLASPDPELEASARQAAAQMKFLPMKLNGQPMEFDLEFTFDFRLNRGR